MIKNGIKVEKGDTLLIEKARDLTPSSILRISLLTPFFEESLFRLPLRFSRVNIAVLLGILLYTIIVRFGVLSAIIIAIVTSGSALYLFRPDSYLSIRTSAIFERKFYYIFYIQALTFGFLHLTNYHLDFKYVLLFPLFILNYIFIGFFLGYVRVSFSNGFIACVLTHIFMNSLYCFFSVI